MTNANELRIGNWVALKDGYFVPIADGGILAINQKRFECYPISLTPEILEKCGFKKSLNGYCYGMITNDGKNRFSIFPDGTFKLGTQDLSVNIHHLHQLQNLYFALTNEELTFEP